MKKLVFAAAAAIIAVALTGCSSDNSVNSAESSSQAGSTTSQVQASSEAESTPAESVAVPATAEESAQGTIDQPAAETSDLSDIYDKIMAQQPAPDDIIMFPESDPFYINGLYPGLTDLNITELALYAPPVTGNACEILLVKAADSDNADKAEKIMQNRVDEAANDTLYPEVADVWKRNARVERSGDMLCMIVLPDSAVIPDDVFSL